MVLYMEKGRKGTLKYNCIIFDIGQLKNNIELTKEIRTARIKISIH